MNKLLWPVAVLFAITAFAMLLTTKGPAGKDSYQRELSRIEQEARLAGVPLTAADVARRPAVLPEDNIASFWPPKDEGSNALPDLAVAELPSLDLGLDPDKPWISGSGALAYVAKKAGEISARAPRAASLGDATNAVRLLKAAHHLALVTAGEGSVLAVLRGLAMDDQAVTKARQVGLLMAAKPEVLSALADSFGDFSFDARAVWNREAYAGIAFARNYDAVQAAHDAIEKLEGQAESNPEAARDLIPENQVRRKGWPYSPEGRSILAQRLQGLTRAYERISPEADPAAFFDQLARASSGTFPEWPGLFARTADLTREQNARIHALRAGLVVMAFRARQGRLPATLAEAKAVERDPFGGELRYEAGTDQFKIWSIGRDRKDNRGDPQSDVFFGLSLPRTR